MAEETFCVGVDVSKGTLDLAVSDSQERWKFSNDDEGISQAVHCIADLKPSIIILEAIGHLEMPLAAALLCLVLWVSRKVCIRERLRSPPGVRSAFCTG